MLLTLIAFVIALGVLIAVHEWGHYRVAVACGVKVLRFSVGLGPAIVRFRPKRQHPGQDTEFVLAAIPFGGYVKMLDGRESDTPLPEEERRFAFDAQPVGKRMLIVAAGPVINLLAAVVLYAAVQWIGVEEPRAILSPPVAGSVAEKAGLEGGETVHRAALAGDALEPVVSFEGLRWLLTRGALDHTDVTLELTRAGSERTVTVTLPMGGLDTRQPDARMLRAIGIVSPLRKPALGKLMPGGAAERAGLKPGDLVLRVGDTPVRDGDQLVELIRASGAHGPPAAAAWRIERDGRELTLPVQPDPYSDKGERVGRIGAEVGSSMAMVTVRYGLFDGLQASVRRVWQVSGLSLRLLGRLVTGDLSIKALSGPVAIADLAGKSAEMGPTYFIGFMAFISVSLGVFNLLPIPVLDGGQLMYYLWEAATGKPVAGVWFERLQYLGVTLLLAMMAVATFNDIVSRIG